MRSRVEIKIKELVPELEDADTVVSEVGIDISEDRGLGDTDEDTEGTTLVPSAEVEDVTVTVTVVDSAVSEAIAFSQEPLCVQVINTTHPCPTMTRRQSRKPSRRPAEDTRKEADSAHQRAGLSAAPRRRLYLVRGAGVARIHPDEQMHHRCSSAGRWSTQDR